MKTNTLKTAALGTLVLFAAACSDDPAPTTPAATPTAAVEERPIITPLPATFTEPEIATSDAAVDDTADSATPDAPSQDAATPYEIYTRGLAEWKSGELEAAEASLEQACWKMENFARARVNLARVRLERGDLSGARAAIDEALGIDEDFAPTYNVLGRILLAAGDRDAAFEAFRRSAQLDPSNPWPLNNMGYALLVAGDPAAAAEPLEQALERDDKLAVAWNNLALVREQLGNLPAAATAAARASALDPRYESVAQRLAPLAVTSEPRAVTIAAHENQQQQIQETHGP